MGGSKQKWTAEGHALAKTYRSPLKFSLGMRWKLPSIRFWKVKLKEINPDRCIIGIPFIHRTQNPFKSIYFAALAGAAELSTGLLGQVAIAGRGRWSMLVVDFRAEYSKKANSYIQFTCEQGQELLELLDRVESSGQPEKIEMISIGKNEEGEEVARMFITWSYLKKKKLV